MVAMTIMTSGMVNAQFLKNLSNAINNASNKSTTTQTSSNQQAASTNQPSSVQTTTTGKVYYVSNTGSGRADGLSATTPKNDAIRYDEILF